MTINVPLVLHTIGEIVLWFFVGYGALVSAANMYAGKDKPPFPHDAVIFIFCVTLMYLLLK